MSYKQLDAVAALTRASDLETVGKTVEAHALLAKALSNKKTHGVWSPELRDAVHKFIDISVRLRKPADLRSVLTHYRASCQTAQALPTVAQQAATAFETAVRRFISQATKAVHQLVPPDDAAAIAAVSYGEDHVSEEYTPEMLTNIAFGGEEINRDSKDRNNAQNAISFLWESYRTVLEVIKSGRQELYQDMAIQAVQFCQLYRRRFEFRRLCVMLRDHTAGMLVAVNNAAAAAAAAAAGDKTALEKVASSSIPSVSDFQAQTLRIRRAQLDCAAALEAWTSVNDLIVDIADVLFPPGSSAAQANSAALAAGTASTQMTNLINQAKITAPSRVETLFHIFRHLAAFLWEGKNHLYHAHALFKLYQLYDAVPQEALGDDPMFKDKATLAAACICAALSISVDQTNEKQDTIIDEAQAEADATAAANKEAKDAKDAIVSGAPTASQQDARMMSILECSREATRSKLITRFVEEGVILTAPAVTHPLVVALEQNVSPLAMHRMVAPALQYFESNDILGRYIPAIRDGYIFTLVQRLAQVFTTISIDKFIGLVPNTEWSLIQRLLLRYSSQWLVPLRIDHAQRVITFLPPPLEATSLATRLTTLVNMTTALARTCEALSMGPNGLAIAAENAANERRDVFRLVRGELAAEHAAVSARINLIDQRIQQEERELAAKLEAEIEAKREAELARKREELKRKEEEARRAAEEKKQLEEKQRQEDELKVYEDYVQKTLSQLPEHMLQSKVAKKVVSLAGRIREAGKEELLRASRKLEAEQRADRERRRKEEFKRLDYTIRAIREEEKPLLVERERKLAEEYDAREKERVEVERKANYENWQKARALLLRIQPVVPLHRAYADSKFAAQREAYQAALIQHQKQMAEYQKKLAEWEAYRQRQREEEARARREEEARQEAIRRQEQEEAEARRREEAAASSWRRSEDTSRPMRMGGGIQSIGAGVTAGSTGSWRSSSASTPGPNLTRTPSGGPSRSFGSSAAGGASSSVAPGSWRQSSVQADNKQQPARK